MIEPDNEGLSRAQKPIAELVDPVQPEETINFGPPISVQEIIEHITQAGEPLVLKIDAYGLISGGKLLGVDLEGPNAPYLLEFILKGEIPGTKATIIKSNVINDGKVNDQELSGFWALVNRSQNIIRQQRLDRDQYVAEHGVVGQKEFIKSWQPPVWSEAQRVGELIKTDLAFINEQIMTKIKSVVDNTKIVADTEPQECTPEIIKQIETLLAEGDQEKADMLLQRILGCLSWNQIPVDLQTSIAQRYGEPKILEGAFPVKPHDKNIFCGLAPSHCSSDIYLGGNPISQLEWIALRTDYFVVGSKGGIMLPNHDQILRPDKNTLILLALVHFCKEFYYKTSGNAEVICDGLQFSVDRTGLQAYDFR